MTPERMNEIKLDMVRELASLRRDGPRLSPLALYRKMDSIRERASESGFATLESLARCTGQMALLPGRRVTMTTCLEHAEDALDQDDPDAISKILAALALRLG